MNLYVSNLSDEVSAAEFRQAFEAFGRVESLSISKDKLTGRSRGFGFAEMPITAEAQAAITGLHGKTLKGRKLTVNAARPRAADRRGGRR